MGSAAAPRRPHVHFTAPQGWLNDPNGLVYDQGTYHLCYQHHPEDTSWGPMHWGHATSTDLVGWRHEPLALRPDHLGATFSGSAVVDRLGVAGLGVGALLAFYTHFVQDEPQSQGLASSTDGGRTWTPYAGNPVVLGREGVIDARDPKVLWFEAPGGGPGHWVMVLATGDHVTFLRSGDLLSWTETSTFGQDRGAHGGHWETPDLFELEVVGASERAWVLVVSVLGGAPAGGSGTQYFVGRFDGEVFAADEPEGQVRWVDHGGDFYAPQSWFGVPEGRRVWIAWMSNWSYGRTTPATTWRGVMTLPRELGLRRTQGGLQLVQQPVAELERHGRTLLEQQGVRLEAGTRWTPPVEGEALDVTVRLTLDGPGCLRIGVHEGSTRVAYDGRRGEVVVERLLAGLEGASAEPQRVRLPACDLPERGGAEVELRIVVDTCSVEVFADGGAVVLTDLVFPEHAGSGLTLVSDEAAATICSIVVRGLDVTQRER